MILTTKQALEALVAGEKIRPTYWPKKCYIFLYDGKIVDNDYEITDFVSTHQFVKWEEPVKDHGGRKYLFQQTGELHWHETSHYFNNDDEFRAFYPGVNNFVSLKSTEVSNG
jgi:hypothetical protein